MVFLSVSKDLPYVSIYFLLGGQNSIVYYANLISK